MASSDAGTITVFNTCSRFGCDPWMTFEVPAGLQPTDVAVGKGPAWDRVYVTNPSAGTLTVITAHAGDPGAVQPPIIPVGGEPTGVAVSPDSRWAYVADKATDSLLFLDTRALAVVRSVPVGADPWGVAASPDGRFVYVAANGAGVVSVVDTATNAVVSTIPVGRAPGDLAVDPTGALLYVTNNADGTVSLIDTGTRSVLATIAVGNQPWGVGATATHAFVANYGSGTVSVISARRRAVVATISTGRNPFGVAVGGTANVLVSNYGSNTLSSIDQMAAVSSVEWSSSKKARRIIGTFGVNPAVAYSIVARRGSVTKRGICRLRPSGRAATCSVTVPKGTWRASIRAQYPWQPVPYGQQDKRFRF